MWSKRVAGLALLFCSLAHGNIEPLAKGYHQLSTLLAADEHEKTSQYAAQLANQTEAWIKSFAPADPSLGWARRIESGAAIMAGTSNPEELRKAYGEVSQGALHLIKGSPLQADWQLYYCPMVKNHWAQPKSEEIANPYMGLEMLECGGKKSWAALP